MSESRRPSPYALVTEMCETMHHTELVLCDSETVSYKKSSDLDPNTEAYLFEGTTGFMTADGLYRQEYVEPSEEIVAENREAVDYVEANIGPVSNGELSLLTAESRVKRTALCTYVLGNVAVRECSFVDSEVRAMFRTSLLVHEQAHSTALPTRRAMLVTTNDETQAQATPAHRYAIAFGMSKPHFSLDRKTMTRGIKYKNHFFEEAFAEESASRFRSKYYPKPQAYLIPCSDGKKRTLPSRYLTTDPSDPNYNLFFSRSAFPAYLLNRLSGYTGIDIYNLMVISRDPEHEVAAKREIVKVIERVEKGLYKKLRNLPYPDSSPEFFEVYDEVMELIEQRETTQKI